MRIVLPLVLATFAALPAFAEAPAKVATCAACHGADGKSTNPALYPHLAGQYFNYLEHSLKDYRAGNRKNPVMGAQAAALTDTEIHELAEYFSAQQGPLYTPSIPAQ